MSNDPNIKVLRILGIRGIPAAHGGFETFAEYLSHYLVERGWRVVVYCQVDGDGPVKEDVWNGIERIHIPVKMSGSLSTIVFDFAATRHAARFNDLCLTLGYNTAVFCILLRLKGITNLINMDGIEWSRAKWGKLAKLWFWLNEWAGCWLGDHLIADHPEIKVHLNTRVCANKITMIPYGAESVKSAPVTPVLALGLNPGMYLTVIARAEPENSLLEIVKGFSCKARGMQLVILGNYLESNSYHRAVKDAASSEVRFVGAIYDKEIVQSLRFHSAAYVHGHQVGGTNPSLVEALGAGNMVIAHDNRFNRWVVGEGAIYFDSALGFSDCLDELISNPSHIDVLRAKGNERFLEFLTWPNVLAQYELILDMHLQAESQRD